MRRLIPFLLITVVFVAGCSRLSGETRKPIADLVPLSELPATYGELVSVTFAPQKNQEFGWREMWFENEETGTITYVPVQLPGWKYSPKLVRTLARP